MSNIFLKACRTDGEHPLLTAKHEMVSKDEKLTKKNKPVSYESLREHVKQEMQMKPTYINKSKHTGEKKPKYGFKLA